MKFLGSLRHGLRWLLLLSLFVGNVYAWTDKQFTTTTGQAREITALIRLLEQIHYNHENVRPSDYGQIIPDFMGELDGQRLFFLATDKEAFTKRYPASWVYNNISSLGKIDPAYEIYKAYASRVETRVQWILAELKKDIDLTTKETYLLDRAKGPWCADEKEADALWSKRLRFEVLQDVLNKKTLEEARQNVRKRYERMLKSLDEVESTELAEWFLSVVTRLYDPHSTYFSYDTFADFAIQMRLQLMGIGALLGVEDDYCVVKEIIPGGPADVSNLLHPNDKILFVGQGDAEPVEVIGMKLRKIVSQIRGDKGTRVKLTIQPADAPDPSIRKEIVLTRDVINLDSARARGAIFEVPDNATGKPLSIGVITLPAFYGPDSSSSAAEKNSATRDVAEILKQLQAVGIQGLVLDLRNNGGGLLSEAIDLTGIFINQGPVVQVRDYYGDVKVDSDENPKIAYTGPLAVLVSRFSASASEIVAGALQNYGRAIIVGDSSTHGKGSVQTVIEMKSYLSSFSLAPEKTGATKLTVQKFYLPDGSSTQLRGVIPDVILPSIDDYLPIGEKDLPHALVWDDIPSSIFDGKPLAPQILNPLREASRARQGKLEEFSFLNKNIDWFKTKQEIKTISLNLEERRTQKAADATFRKTMEKQKELLAKNSFTFREFNLGNPPVKKSVEKKPAAEDSDEDAELAAIRDEGYAKFDIHLREALRIVTDAVDLGSKPESWAGSRAPLTAQVTPKL
ncbi:MAG: carboxy terminal-processing peptidase [Verrucomicrobia bacterium]|nr:carboxy terminal-processing peptidase [Verrucomicrobiota bacterium]